MEKHWRNLRNWANSSHRSSFAAPLPCLQAFGLERALDVLAMRGRRGRWIGARPAGFCAWSATARWRRDVATRFESITAATETGVSSSDWAEGTRHTGIVAAAELL